MKLYIIGSGNHAGVVIDACRTAYIEGLLDDVNPVGAFRHGREIKGKSDMFIKYPDAFDFHIAIGDNSVREKLSTLKNRRYATIKHPSATLTNKQDCIGSFFAANSFIGNNSTVGNFTIVNSGAILDHDSSVGDFSHLCPGVVTGGRVRIGNRTTIGLGAMIRDGITVGNNCVVGMGSVVIENVPDGAVVYGNPAIRRNL